MKNLLWLLLLAPSIGFAQMGHTIKQKNRRFDPAEITVRRGDGLTFTNDDEFIHQIYVTDLFDSDERRPGQTLVENFQDAGTFEVRCHIHPKMKLTVHVN